MARKVSKAERKDGTYETTLGKKKYEVVTETKMGSDGVIEDHMSFIGARGKIVSMAKELKCRNVMSNADRKRLGIQ